MKLYVTRHGRTNYNDARLCNDDASVDVHITDEGTAQAKQVAKKLKDMYFDRIIVSTLPRTHQTADIINSYHQVPVEVDGRISDNRTGFEGKPVDEYFAARDAADDSWAYKAAGAESLYDVQTRVEEFLEDLKAKPYNSVLVVTHQCVIRQIVGILRGLSREATDAIDVLQGDYVDFEL